VIVQGALIVAVGFAAIALLLTAASCIGHALAHIDHTPTNDRHDARNETQGEL
jgi:hypothetical protein